jgi:hypothetical protein
MVVIDGFYTVVSQPVQDAETKPDVRPTTPVQIAVLLLWLLQDNFTEGLSEPTTSSFSLST